MASTDIVIAHGIWKLLNRVMTFVPYDVSVIGASETGKTTLDRQLTTRGEIQKLGESDRTHHKKSWLGTYKMPDTTRKRVVSDGKLAKTIVSRDLGGHIEYHSTWLRDMINRNCSSVVVVIDHRHMSDAHNVDNQTALGYLVRGLSDKKNLPKGLTWRMVESQGLLSEKSNLTGQQSRRVDDRSRPHYLGEGFHSKAQDI